MSDFQVFLGALLPLAFLLSFFLTRLAIRYALGRQLLDQPGPRRSHHEATPRGGGIAVVATFLLAAAVAALTGQTGTASLGWIAGGSAVMCALGFWEDHKPLSRRLRLLAQLLTSAAVAWGLGVHDPAFVERIWPDWLALVGTPVRPWLLSGLVVVAMVWMVNLFNFMDGINGLAGCETVFACAVFAAVAAVAGFQGQALLLGGAAAAALGFLPWNFPHAKVFLGDSGSYGIGFLLAAVLVDGAQAAYLSPWVGIAVLGLFVMDASLTLAFRVVSGARWYNPHREHAYQLMVRRGWRHASVVFAASAVNLLFILPVLWLGGDDHQSRASLAVLLGLTVLWLGLRFYFGRQQDSIQT